jgi:hypothetical protein
VILPARSPVKTPAVQDKPRRGAADAKRLNNRLRIEAVERVWEVLPTSKPCKDSRRGSLAGRMFSAAAQTLLAEIEHARLESKSGRAIRLLYPAYDSRAILKLVGILQIAAPERGAAVFRLLFFHSFLECLARFERR